MNARTDGQGLRPTARPDSWTSSRWGGAGSAVLKEKDCH